MVLFSLLYTNVGLNFEKIGGGERLWGEYLRFCQTHIRRVDHFFEGVFSMSQKNFKKCQKIVIF